MAGKGIQTALICILYVFALVLGIAAFLLPYWVTAELDAGVRNVSVIKDIDSGLVWKRQSYFIKPDSISDSDDWFESIAGSELHTESVRVVTGLTITGLVMLLLGCVPTFSVLCCTGDDEKGNNRVSPILIALGITTVFASGLIVSGPIIYYYHVTGDYGVKKEHLGASCWIASASAGLSFLAGIATIIMGSRYLNTKDNGVGGKM